MPTILCPACRQLIETPGGSWHVGAYDSVWQLQAGQLLRAHATRGGPIEVPIPGKARVHDVM